MRISQKVLNNLFKNIWMMLLTLLIQIFNANKDNTKNRLGSPNLILAALKVIELISVIGIDEFNLH